MSGRRILDLIAILQASRAVASQIALHSRHKYNAYSKTSSLAHALQRRSGQGNVATKTSSIRRQTSNNPGLYANKVDNRDEHSSARPTEEKNKTFGNEEIEESIRKDPSYRTLDANSSIDPPSDAIKVKRETTRHSLSTDDNIPFNSDKKSLKTITESTRPSPDEARRLQRRSEDQIPSEVAEPPPTLPQTETTKDFEGLHVDQEQDVFFRAPQKIGAVLSALPRVKLPKYSETVQETDEHLSHKNLNRDVFYSAVGKGLYRQSTNVESSSEQQNLSEEVFSNLFQSRKVAAMMSENNHSFSKQAKDKSHQDQQHLRRPESVTQGDPPGSRPNAITNDSANDMQQLGSSLASDLKNSTDDVEEVSLFPPLKATLLIC